MVPLSLDRFFRRPAAADRPLVIGLVNNMPDAALKTSERQFRELLMRAAGDLQYELQVFSFGAVEEAGFGARCPVYVRLRSLQLSRNMVGLHVRPATYLR